MILVTVLGVIVGVLLGFVLARLIRRMGPGSESVDVQLPVDLHHSLDLMRRAYDLELVCLVEGDEHTTIAASDPRPPPAEIDRAVSTAKLAMADGRAHTVREARFIYALGDGPYGAAIVARTPDLSETALEDVRGDFRRIMAGLRVRDLQGSMAARFNGKSRVSAARESIETLSATLAHAAAALTDRPAAVAVRDLTTRTIVIEAISPGGDRRLSGASVAADSAVGRAVLGDTPVVGNNARELLGKEVENRRREEISGTAFPIQDGREGVGAIVVFGSLEMIAPSLREHLIWLAGEAGPRIGAAAAIRRAEERAVTDELTGLPNRRSLDRVMGQREVTEGALLLVDIDYFKKVNDTYGHAAGDAALKHLARVLRSTLREHDVAARIGGEEFALWLPQAGLEEARQVAERVRSNLAASHWVWAGKQVDLTCSVGVAASPECSTQKANLMASADAALYRAKERGRNRVELAPLHGR